MKMKNAWQRWGWPLLKVLLALAILLAVGHRFYDDLSHLDTAHFELRPAWLFVSSALYALGLWLSAWYWYHLLHVFGDRPRLSTAGRAYFLGHLGKYVPGKAWALLLRGSFVRGPQVRFGVAIITSFYEVLTTMAAGSLFAAVVFAFDPPNVPGLDWHPLLTGLLLLAVCGVPLMPAVFNFIVRRMAARFEKVDSYQLPRLRLGTLIVGLLATGLGWSLLGLGVWALLQAVVPGPPELNWANWLRCSGSIGLAYVAGFLILFLPGGLGAREYFLVPLLGFAGGRPVIAAAVLLLRVVWTATEVAIALVMILIRHGRDTETRRHGDTEEQRQSEGAVPTSDQPGHPFSVSPCPRVSVSSLP